MTIPDLVDVLVVGAGPTGLMLANELARRNVRALTVDRNDGPSIRTKALGVQARTLEIYARLGIAGKAVELGTPAASVTLWVDGRRAARVPLGDIGRGVSRYPYVLILGQDDNERLLGEGLRARGGEVRWSTELVGLSRRPDHVRALLRTADGSTAVVRAAWVAGCDGAHSAVRAMTGIGFPGAPYEHEFYVADTRTLGPMAPGELNAFLRRDSFHLFFPLRGADHWRIVGIVPPNLRGRNQLSFDDVVPAIRAVVKEPLEIRECSWFSTYRIHHRRAERFREGPFFLLGDAAHVHSPVGAQGMNTGLQDAYNLGWKLALVASGRADDRLLDSYAAERVPFADRLLRTTDRLFAMFVSGRRSVGWLRERIAPRLLAFAMTREAVRTLAFRTISQTGIRYPGSPLSETLAGLPQGAPRAGDRFPWLHFAFEPDSPAEDLFERLDDTRFNLVLFGQAPASGWRPAFGDLVTLHEVPDEAANDRECARAGIPKPSFFLLRPDGHIGLAGLRPDAAALTRYFAERVCLRGESGKPTLPRKAA